MFFTVVNIPVLRFKTDRTLLTGKPVAVTSNRGTGWAPLRPGANPQVEWQYYQNKILRGKAGTDTSCTVLVHLSKTSAFCFGSVVTEIKAELKQLAFSFSGFKGVSHILKQNLNIIQMSGL